MKKDTVIAAMAGLALAVMAVIVLEFLDDTLRIAGSVGETAEDMPVLGTLAKISGQNDRVIIRSKPRSPEAEAVRQMRTKVILASPHGKLDSLSVTSPQEKDGKTNVAANLGVAMAAGGLRVVLLDGDMRSPALHESFDLPNLFGLAELVSAGRSECERLLKQALRKTDVVNLYLITAGRPPLDPSVLLTSPRMPELMMLLHRQFDVIIIDSPPVLVAPDATIVASLVEGTLLVVSPGRTSRSMTRRSRDQLQKQEDSTVLGLVLNRMPLSHYVYHYAPEARSIEQPTWRIPRLVERLRTRFSQSSDGELVSLGHAARELGIRRETAKRWHRQGRLPGTRQGLRLWVRRKDLQALLDDKLPSDMVLTTPDPASPSATPTDNGHETFWIPLSEAAERIGVDLENALARCEAEDIPTVQRNGRWWVDEAKHEALLAPDPEPSTSGVAET